MQGAGQPLGGERGRRGLGSAKPCEMEHREGWVALPGVSVCGITPWLSPQAYVNRFKFQSITADDALGFFLEYFPELKEKGVDSIPGQHLPGQGTGRCFIN